MTLVLISLLLCECGTRLDDLSKWLDVNDARWEEQPFPQKPPFYFLVAVIHHCPIWNAVLVWRDVFQFGADHMEEELCSGRCRPKSKVLEAFSEECRDVWTDTSVKHYFHLVGPSNKVVWYDDGRVSCRVHSICYSSMLTHQKFHAHLTNW